MLVEFTHSLRNPIVEQCLLETLRTVYDIWKDAGQIDEIHIELGRKHEEYSGATSTQNK